MIILSIIRMISTLNNLGKGKSFIIIKASKSLKFSQKNIYLNLRNQQNQEIFLCMFQITVETFDLSPIQINKHIIQPSICESNKLALINWMNVCY